MTDDPIDGDTSRGDDTLRAALLAEVPDRSDGYWASIDDRLRTTATSASPTLAARDITAEATGTVDSADSTAAGLLTRLRTWPVIAAAAALIVIAALFAVQFVPQGSERVDVGFTDGERIDSLIDLPGPTQNVHHWHAVYGVWDCTANGGAGDWLPVFESTEDDVGIHSHGDGLIYIHPFFEESAGRNATFSHFTDSMNFTMTNDTIALEDGTVLNEGAMCGGEPAQLQMLRWQDARALEADPSLAPRVITSDFASERFYNDLEVWTIALAPEGATIPLPPQTRFDELAVWWFEPTEIAPVLVPTPVPGQVGLSPPQHDVYVNVGLVANGDSVDPVVETLRASRPQGLPLIGSLISGSGTQWRATALHVRLKVDFVTYSLLDEADGLAPTLDCQELLLWGGGCSRSDDVRANATRIDTHTGADIETLTLWNGPAEAVWLSLVIDDGQTIVAEVVQGTSLAPWRIVQGDWVSVELLDIDHNVLWSRSNE